MKKQSLKMLLHLLISIVICFVLIYVFIFVGGFKLFVAKDPILYEIAAAIGMGLLIWIIYEMYRYFEKRIKGLEERISKLENQ